MSRAYFLLFVLISPFCWAEPADHRLTEQLKLQIGGNALQGTGGPLTAAEVLAGGWKQYEEGGCDLVKGCPYKNLATGEIRFLPLSEKKKLPQDAKKEVAQEPKAPSLTEIADEEAFNAAFGDSTKKAVFILFGASDCDPCKEVKKLLNSKVAVKPQTGFFTATRPTYLKFEGHPLHEKWKDKIGNSVPVVFLYTRGPNGEWVPKVLRGKAITNALDNLQ